jgi:K+-sensing histidine kinase KdpD
LPLIKKMLEYIVDNAMKFSPDKGEIIIEAEVIDNFCIIKISDQGNGIPVDQFEEIFDEFAICDIMHHECGQGLSLAICKHIAELHGGDILAENNKNGGAIFTLRLPIKQQ